MFKIIALVIGAIAAWVIITQPAASAPVVAALIKSLAGFVETLVSALFKLVHDSTGTLRGR